MIVVEAVAVFVAVIAALAAGYRWGRPPTPRERWPEWPIAAPPRVHVTRRPRERPPA